MMKNPLDFQFGTIEMLVGVGTISTFVSVLVHNHEFSL